MLLGSEKKEVLRKRHRAAGPQTGLHTWGLGRRPKVGLVQAPSSRVTFWPWGLQLKAEASASGREVLGEAQGSLASPCLHSGPKGGGQSSPDALPGL